MEFRQYACDALGEAAATELFSQIEKGGEPASVRRNPFKTGNVPEGEPVAWSRYGIHLPERPVFTLDPLFHAGAYYVQEASSMYMELAAAAIEAECSRGDMDRPFFGHPVNALDLCAAPGGKSTHLLSLLDRDALLVSNEVIRSRATVLADNIARWGTDNAVVTNNDPADFGDFGGFFHLVVVDAPCSGEGLFRKDPNAIAEWSPANVELCAQRQRRILADIWPALRPGGFLIYSTCTYNAFENDGNLRYLQEMFGAAVLSVPLPEGSGILHTPAGGIQFVPGQVRGEGQFMAVVRKPGGADVSEDFFQYGVPVRSARKQERRNGRRGSAGERGGQSDKGCRFLPDGEYVKILSGAGDLLKAYREALYPRIRFVEEHLRTVLSGTALAVKKGKDYIPHADFALQAVLQRMYAEQRLPGGIHAVEVDRETALRFLAKEPLSFPDAPLAYLLVVHAGYPLGFVKNLGNRSNNLLPMARRIRMDLK